MARVYHALGGWRAKRQHLALFAPYFPWPVTCKLSYISQWLVYAARVHAGEFGAELPVPPSTVSFRLKPEQVEYLRDFVNRPELTQTLASSQGAGDWKCELKLRPEQLARKDHEIVPDHLREDFSQQGAVVPPPEFLSASSRQVVPLMCHDRVIRLQPT